MMLDGEGGGGASDFGSQSFNRSEEGCRIKFSQPGRGSGSHGDDTGGFVVADPDEGPVRAVIHLQGVDGVGWEEAGFAGFHGLPRAIGVDGAVTSETGEEKGSGLAGPEDFVGRTGIHDAGVENVVICEEGAGGSVLEPIGFQGLRNADGADAGFAIQNVDIGEAELDFFQSGDGAGCTVWNKWIGEYLYSRVEIRNFSSFQFSRVRKGNGSYSNAVRKNFLCWRKKNVGFEYPYVESTHGHDGLEVVIFSIRQVSCSDNLPDSCILGSCRCIDGNVRCGFL